jgi:hypothetical protein
MEEMNNNYFSSDENYEGANASPPTPRPDREEEKSALSGRGAKID